MVCIIMYSTKMQVVSAKKIMSHSPKRAKKCLNSAKGDQIDDNLRHRPSRIVPKAGEDAPGPVSSCTAPKCRWYAPGKS